MFDNGARHPILLFAFLLSAACGDNGETAAAAPDSGAAGTGGFSGAGGNAGAENDAAVEDSGVAGGDAGAACLDDPKCCPPAQPTHGSACNKSVTCKYVRDDCTPSITIEAACVDGNWSSLALASCALSTSAACDPLGSWSVTSEESLYYSEHESLAPPLSFALSLKNGAVFSTLSGIGVSTDGCTITGSASDTQDVPPIPDAWTTVTESLSLTVQGAGGATGTYSAECSGECGWTETIAVTAVKSAPQ